jgi:hypothetical protein
MSEVVKTVSGNFGAAVPGGIQDYYDMGVIDERERIIALLIDLDAIRRDALGSLVAFNTHGTEVIYLPGLEGESK